MMHINGKMKLRKVSERSLENLKLGAVARRKGKIRCTVTLLPETKEWLERGGNMSGRIDEMVAKVLSGELIGRRKLDEALERIRLLEERGKLPTTKNPQPCND